MKTMLFYIVLWVCLAAGCAGTPVKDKASFETVEACVEDCRFRDGLCRKGCDRKWTSGKARTPGSTGVEDDRLSCRERCRQKLDDCVRQCTAKFKEPAP